MSIIVSAIPGVLGVLGAGLLGYLGVGSEDRKRVARIGFALAILGPVGQIAVGVLQQLDADAAERKHDAQSADLGAQTKKLNEQLAPFIAAAKSTYPTADIQGGLTKLAGDLQQLDRRTTEVERKTTGRSLTSEQRASIATLLRASPPTRVVVLGSGDDETQRFAAEFNEVLAAARWRPEPGQNIGAVQAPAGVTVVVGKQHDYPAAATALAGALKQAGVDAPIKADLNIGSDEIEVLVGPKPL